MLLLRADLATLLLEHAYAARRDGDPDLAYPVAPAPDGWPTVRLDEAVARVEELGWRLREVREDRGRV